MSNENDKSGQAKASVYVELECNSAGCRNAQRSGEWGGNFKCAVLNHHGVIVNLEGYSDSGGCDSAVVGGRSGVLFNKNRFEPKS